jgi:hypothetical protein
MMRKAMCACSCLIVGLLVSTQSFAKHPLEGKIGKGPVDHRVLAMQYEEEADANKAKAESWEFAAEYYEKFPEAFSDSKMTVAEHVDNLRSVAEQYRMAEQKDRELAAKHRALIRRGP